MANASGRPAWSPLVVVWLCVSLAAAACGGSSAEAGEIFLESALDIGRDPFVPVVTIPELPESADFELTSIGAPTASAGDEPADQALVVVSVPGDEPGLYGGSQDQAVCDAEQLDAFLEDNPREAAAWAGVLGIEIADISGYIAGLTPVLLRVSTRVTNHGFRDGDARPLQSVLQAGTAVLIDDRGVPRVRCACGNPLLEPAVVSETVSFQGEAWDDFDSENLAVVSPGEPQTDFTLVSVADGHEFTRPAGTSGESDIPTAVLGERVATSTTTSPLRATTSTTTSPLRTTTSTSPPSTSPPSTSPPSTSPPSTSPPSTSPPPTTPPPTTPPPTTPPAPPVLSGGNFEFNPSNDATCEAAFPGEGTRGVRLTAKYSDVNGNALGTLYGDFGPGNPRDNLNPFTSFQGDGFGGGIRSEVCSPSFNTIGLTLADKDGLDSNELNIVVHNIE